MTHVEDTAEPMFITDDQAARRIRKVSQELRMPTDVRQWRLDLLAGELDAVADLLDPRGDE
jgi:hypothetical protein